MWYCVTRLEHNAATSRIGSPVLPVSTHVLHLLGRVALGSRVLRQLDLNSVVSCLLQWHDCQRWAEWLARFARGPAHPCE